MSFIGKANMVPPCFGRMSLCVLVMLTMTLKAQEIWVSPAGNDFNPGTREQPLASITAALHRVGGQNIKNGATNEALRIILKDGIFPLTETLCLDSEDSGTEPSPVIIEAAPGSHPVLSGGIALSGWHRFGARIPRLDTHPNRQIWVAEAPRINGRVLDFRQLWVNGTKAIRARNPDGEKLARITAWDKTNQTAIIPASVLSTIRKPGALEMVIDQVWETAVLRVKSIQVNGAKAMLKFKEPESSIEFHHPWPPVIVNTNYQAPFYLVNAIQFLDSPGEWFEDTAAGKIYYRPREGEDMPQARAFAPALESLMRVEGSPEKPAGYIQFKNLTFAHTTWLRPSEQGNVPLQAGMFLLAARKLSPRGTSYHHGLDNVAWIGRPPAAVLVKNAHHITFEGCTFEHTAAAGLDFFDGTHDDWIEGCVFRDIGGNGIQLGKFSDTNVETHIPWNPADEREICTRETIANNVVTDCGTEDWGSVGIGIGYARQVVIKHNEVFNQPYTGISVGWGWTKMTNALRDNFIIANHVHHVGQRLGDLGGIYTLSAQPGTVIADNSIHDISPNPFVPDPQHWFYLYLDEGSSFITVSNNWCPAEKFLKNANGPGNVWSNNGPQVSEQIKNAAGLEPAFQSLLSPISP